MHNGKWLKSKQERDFEGGTTLFYPDKAICSVKHIETSNAV